VYCATDYFRADALIGGKYSSSVCHAMLELSIVDAPAQ
jgi:hypothetical protein